MTRAPRGEVVLIGADSSEAVRKTRANYFDATLTWRRPAGRPPAGRQLGMHRDQRDRAAIGHVGQHVEEEIERRACPRRSRARPRGQVLTEQATALDAPPLSLEDLLRLLRRDGLTTAMAALEEYRG